MRDTKSLLLLLVSLLLVLVSFVLIWTWGYNYYAKPIQKQAVNGNSCNPAGTIATSKGFFAKSVYCYLIQMDMQLDSTLNNSDSLNTELDIKLTEFYRLRNEIAAILKSQAESNNLSVAKRKIDELQAKVDDI